MLRVDVGVADYCSGRDQVSEAGVEGSVEDGGVGMARGKERGADVGEESEELVARREGFGVGIVIFIRRGGG